MYTYPDLEDGFLDSTILVEWMRLDIDEQFLEGLCLCRAILFEDILKRDNNVWIGNGGKGRGFGEVGQGAAGALSRAPKPAKGTEAGSGDGLALVPLHVDGGGRRMRNKECGRAMGSLKLSEAGFGDG